MSFVGNLLKNIESSLLGAIDGGVASALSSFGLGGSGIAGETTIVPGDVDIIGINIVDENKQKPYNIRDQVKTIDIYEDIRHATVFCILGIQDGVDLNKNYVFTGDEYVLIDIKTPGNSKPSSYFLRVRSAPKNIITDPNNKFKTYNIELRNPDVKKSSGRNMNTTVQTLGSDAVKDILTNELSTTMKINLEETKGLYPLVLQQIRPFKAIDQIRRSQLAVSKQYASDSYLFFQNKFGYNFVTLEKLLHDASTSLRDPFNDRIFFFDNGSSNMNMQNMTMRNILALEYVQTSDADDMIGQGGIYTKLNTTDLITGTRKTFEYKIQNNSDKYYLGAESGKGGSLFNQKFLQNHSQKTSNILHAPVSSGQFTELGVNYDPTTYAEKMINTIGFVNQATQTSVLMEVYGDTDITAGVGVKCYLPEVSGMTTDDGKSNKLFSGNYLVTAVRHMIVNSSRPQHIMSMALIRGTLGGK
jgi:hypothetical protein